MTPIVAPRDFPLSPWRIPFMLGTMLPRLISVVSLCLWVGFAVSCGGDPDTPMLAGNTRAAATEGEAMFQKAQAADHAGKTGRAIKLYDRTATRFPSAPSAAQARYRQAQMLDQEGKVLDAFDAYDKYLSRFPGSSNYSAVLARQAEIANSAAKGDIKQRFLVLKTKLSSEKTVEMLGKVKDRAPKSRTAAKAQLSTGEIYRHERKNKEAIAAYRQLVKDQPEAPESPEALFRVGQILLEEAEQGNQNQANIDLAREAFNDYLLQYPGHSRNTEARMLLATLGGRDLQRSYDIAEFYLKTGKTESAKVYYRDIVTRTATGTLHDASKARLKELGE